MPILTQSVIDNMKYEGKDKTIFDSELKGFGIRIRKGSKSWIIMYRNRLGVQKKLTLCKTDKLTPDEARKLAKEKLADVVRGADPQTDKINARKGNEMKEEIITTTVGKSKYPMKCSNFGNSITSVEINGSKLDYAFDSDVLDFTEQPSKPNKFFIKYDENKNIVFYPTPDDAYSVKISYE